VHPDPKVVSKLRFDSSSDEVLLNDENESNDVFIRGPMR
jgi:hypothetical protein